MTTNPASSDPFEFDLLFTGDVTDANGNFLEEPLEARGSSGANGTAGAGSAGMFYDPIATGGGFNTGMESGGANAASFRGTIPPPPGTVPLAGIAGSTGSSTPKEKTKKNARDSKVDDDDDEKKAKRRKQIAAASRMSRARRKRELEDLRDENERLREERSQFLAKIGELQLKVESLREQGSTDMRIENELLRAQLEEHKRFVACFKRLSEGAPSSTNARHTIYKQGAETAHAHVLGLISQSQADDWQQATVPLEADLPYQNFSVYYKFKDEYGSSEVKDENGKAPGGGPAKKPRRRLNVRVDVLFPGIDASALSDFFWDSFSNTAVQQRLYSVKGVELTQLTDDMPDKDTKMVYYRERYDGQKDQDLVLICHRKRKELAKSTLALPHSNKTKPAVGKVAAMVMAMSTTQHSAAPEYPGANRITSMFVQGCVMWNVMADSRLCVVFSFPDNVKLKAIQSLDEVIHNGAITMKFVEILRSYRTELGNM